MISSITKLIEKVTIKQHPEIAHGDEKRNVFIDQNDKKNFDELLICQSWFFLCDWMPTSSHSHLIMSCGFRAGANWNAVGVIFICIRHFKFEWVARIDSVTYRLKSFFFKLTRLFSSHFITRNLYSWWNACMQHRWMQWK